MKLRTLVVAGAFAVSAATIAVAQGGPDLKRTREAGGVSVTVTPLNLSDRVAVALDFEVSMDTHSGDLAFEMTKIATLMGETGEEVPPSLWSGGKGGHHLSGKLSFPAERLQDAASLRLTLKGAGGGKDLSFEWKRLSTAAIEGKRVSVEGGHYTNITPPQLDRMLKEKDFTLVNVHVPYEGEIKPTDAFIPYDQTTKRIKEYPTDKVARIAVYCRSGRMSDLAARELVKAGYVNVFNLEGGMIAWEKAGFPLEFAGGKR